MRAIRELSNGSGRCCSGELDYSSASDEEGYLRTAPLAADELVAPAVADTVPSESPSTADGRFKTVWIAQQGTPAGGAFAFVLAGYGDARVAVELARGFRKERTVYALQPPEARGTHPSLHEVVDEYASSLRECQPEGPYHIGGYSAGGLIALEIARRLRQQGHEVGVVAVLDPLFARYRNIAVAGYRAMKWTVESVSPAVARRFRILRILNAMVRDEALAFHLHALNGHRPLPYPGEIHLFWTRTPFPLRPPRAMSHWRAIGGGGLIVHRAPGTHHSFMRPPHVQCLASTLDAMIDRRRA